MTRTNNDFIERTRETIANAEDTGAELELTEDHRAAYFTANLPAVTARFPTGKVKTYTAAELVEDCKKLLTRLDKMNYLHAWAATSVLEQLQAEMSQ